MKRVIPIIGFLLLFVTMISAEADIHAQSQAEFSLEEATIQSIHDAMKQRKISCEQLVHRYLERIKLYNLSVENHAPINAFTQINPNVISQAQKLDVFYSQTGNFWGPLHCIPVVLKDNINSYDATTSSGSLALLGNQPNQDAFLVKKLRRAGAIILAKGSMDELAFGIFGISSRSGRIGNVYNPEKNPGGSSGGPAAAVSANFAVVGIGTDNSGSIRIPAAFNGIYGLRPSTGLISQTGIFPAGNLDGTAGPLTRRVEDLAKVLDVIAQKDPQDEKTFPVPRVSTYTHFLNPNGLKNKRIGIVRQVGQRDPFEGMPDDITAIFKQALQTLTQEGVILVDNIRLPEFNNDRSANMAGMRQDVDAYLASYPAVRKNFQDLCESDRTRLLGDRERCLKFIYSMPIKFGDDYKKALALFQKNQNYVEAIMRHQKLDALLLPISTVGVATYNDRQVNTWLAPISSNAGLPSITLNLGYSNPDKMPIGFELIGKKYAEGKLIEIAYAYEKNSPNRLIPLMPEKNAALKDLDIPAYNNLLTEMGYKSYLEFLKNNQSNPPFKVLTPDKFRKLVSQVLASFKIKNSFPNDGNLSHTSSQ